MRSRTPDSHADWLALLDVEGRFLSVPVLRELFSTGLPPLDAAIRREAAERLAGLTPASPEAERDAWIDWLLRTALDWGDCLHDGDITCTIPEHRTAVEAHRVLRDRDRRVRVVVLRAAYGTSFDSADFADGWRATALDRAELLARQAGAQIAFITDGSRIAVQWVPPAEEGHGGYGVWHADLFAESAERTLFAAFVALFSARRFFGSLPQDEPEAIFSRSAQREAELTDTLGRQVRAAVELLVAAFWRADRERAQPVLRAVPPNDVYQAAATVVMRLVFLLFAEERQLLPLADPLYARCYAVSTLRGQLDADAVRLGDEPLELRASSWRRLLAAFAAVHDGIEHDRLRQPGYGGRLFEPLRHGFLADLGVDDLTVRAVLEALQVVAGRRLSFLHLDVEQIGHIYEGLLDHDVVRVEDVHVVLAGAGDEARVPVALAQLEAWREHDDVRAIGEALGRSESAIRRSLRPQVDDAAMEIRRLLTDACESDAGLVARVTPYAALIARDLRGIPIIIPAGGLVVKKTRARRDSGTEYTPRALAEEIVLHTLEPLAYAPGAPDGAPREAWVLRPSHELLALRIVDPACGSGAFLVSACRFLADRVVEAWKIEGGVIDDDAVRDAQRLVAQRCLYGVDRDVMAVEMAKLSLWLLTFAHGKPFGFLDHALRPGDSLLGITSLDQLTALHLDSEHGLKLHRSTLFDHSSALMRLVGEARESRREIEEGPPRSLSDAERQAELQARAESATHIARLAADGVIAIELAMADRPQQERDAALLELADDVIAVLDGDRDRAAALRECVERRLNQGRPEHAPPRQPLHWPLEFPEAFDGGAFDAVVTNPPFVDGRSISRRFGPDYRVVIQRWIAEGRKGHADLIAYFLLRASQIGSRFGAISTKTISQGVTREVCLDALCSSAWRIVRAERSHPWPGSAAVYVSEIWCAYGLGNDEPVLNGLGVKGISPLLAAESTEYFVPRPLQENRGIASQGSILMGKGFLLSLQQGGAYIDSDPRNADVLRLFITSSDICDSVPVAPSRYAIDFKDRSEEEAKRYAVLYSHLQSTVLLERNTEEKRRRWWVHWRRRAELYNRISQLREVIVIPRISKYTIPVRLPSSFLYDAMLIVLASESYTLQGLVTSSIHFAWARSREGALGTTPHYTAAECFETFPRPMDSSGIEESMRELESCRDRLMEESDQSLTVLYNSVHDPKCDHPSLVSLRRRHQELDCVIARAYGWTDVDMSFDFRKTPEGIRWAFARETRIEIVDRLQKLNAERVASESSSDLAAAKPKRTRRSLDDTQLALEVEGS